VDSAWAMVSVDTHMLFDFVEKMRQYAADAPFRSEVRSVETREITGEIVLPQRRTQHERAFAIVDDSVPARIVLLAIVDALVYSRKPKMVDYSVQIVTDPRFPLGEERLLVEFASWFPQAFLQRIGGRNTGFLLFVNGDTTSRRVGASVLPCNVWLEEQVAHDVALDTLVPEWTKRYRLDRGQYPRDVRRSFAKAVAGCEQRMAKRRNREGAQ
jgi:hypothetical protein